MNKDTLPSSSSKTISPIEINLDEFQISEESFKPMTKGLGFHQDTKRPSFKPAPREVKPFGSVAKTSMASTLSSMSSSNIAKPASVAAAASTHMPSGLEAFYGTKTVVTEMAFESKESEGKLPKNTLKTAPATAQFLAWIVDILVIASFVVLTGALLVFASGIELRMYSKLISQKDLIIFSAAIFSIYYLLYFTILDLSASPGKTVFSIKLVKSSGGNVSVKHTFLRALVSLLSGVALFLPMLLDFQGRLSDTKLVK